MTKKTSICPWVVFRGGGHTIDHLVLLPLLHPLLPPLRSCWGLCPGPPACPEPQALLQLVLLHPHRHQLLRGRPELLLRRCSELVLRPAAARRTDMLWRRSLHECLLLLLLLLLVLLLLLLHLLKLKLLLMLLLLLLRKAATDARCRRRSTHGRLFGLFISHGGMEAIDEFLDMRGLRLGIFRGCREEAGQWSEQEEGTVLFPTVCSLRFLSSSLRSAICQDMAGVEGAAWQLSWDWCWCGSGLFTRMHVIACGREDGQWLH